MGRQDKKYDQVRYSVYNFYEMGTEDNNCDQVLRCRVHNCHKMVRYDKRFVHLPIHSPRSEFGDWYDQDDNISRILFFSVSS